MPACEKCWKDAHFGGPDADISARYQQLLNDRKDNPCTPEEQAGEGALMCPTCGNMTIHQYTLSCMACGVSSPMDAFWYVCGKWQ